MSYDNTNRGTMGRNKRRESDKHPEFTGSINVDGKNYWINAWVQENKADGSKFFSLSVKPKEGGHEAPAPVQKQAPLDDSIPF